MESRLWLSCMVVPTHPPRGSPCPLGKCAECQPGPFLPEDLIPTKFLQGASCNFKKLPEETLRRFAIYVSAIVIEEEKKKERKKTCTQMTIPSQKAFPWLQLGKGTSSVDSFPPSSTSTPQIQAVPEAGRGRVEGRRGLRNNSTIGEQSETGEEGRETQACGPQEHEDRHCVDFLYSLYKEEITGVGLPDVLGAEQTKRGIGSLGCWSVGMDTAGVPSLLQCHQLPPGTEGRGWEELNKVMHNDNFSPVPFLKTMEKLEFPSQSEWLGANSKNLAAFDKIEAKTFVL
ncbi:hypothetical protein E2320_018153 [Naja naja]|nr:hypothetical protein E2320_018153 [Naja naja]